MKFRQEQVGVKPQIETIEKQCSLGCKNNARKPFVLTTMLCTKKAVGELLRRERERGREILNTSRKGVQ